MNKIYLILRNNQHEGPYSVSEMMSLSVKKQDFIKVQGSKKGWQYAADIPELSHLAVEDSLESTPDTDQPVEEIAETPKTERIMPVEVLAITSNTPVDSPVFFRVPGLEPDQSKEEKQNIPERFAGSTYIISNEKYEEPANDFQPVSGFTLPSEELPTAISSPFTVHTDFSSTGPVSDDAHEEIVEQVNQPVVAPESISTTPELPEVLAPSSNARENASSSDDFDAAGLLSEAFEPEQIQIPPQADESEQPLFEIADDSFQAAPEPSTQSTLPVASQPVESLATLTFEERIERIRKAANAAAVNANIGAGDHGVMSDTPLAPSKQLADEASAPVYVSLPTEVQQPEITVTHSVEPTLVADKPIPVLASTGGAMVTPPSGARRDVDMESFHSAKASQAAYISLPVEPSALSSTVSETGTDDNETLSFDQRIEKVRALSLASSSRPAASKAGAAQKVRNPNLFELTKKNAAETGKGPVERTTPKRFANKKAVLVGASAILLFAASVGLFRYFEDDTNRTSSSENAVSTEREQTAVAVRHEPAPGEESLATNTLAPENTSAPEQQIETKALPVEKAETNAPVLTVPEAQTKIALPSVVKAKAPEKIELPSERPREKAEVKSATPASTKDLTEQIYLKSNFATNDNDAGVFDLNVSLQNKSDKVLKTVAVNVFYNDKDGKVLNRQTLYFTDIKPGETVSKAGSPHKSAAKAHCELGLVSSEGSLYYSN